MMTDKEKLNALLDIIVGIVTNLRLIVVLAGDNFLVTSALNKILTETTSALQNIK
jgi:hypothetical protein